MKLNGWQRIGVVATALWIVAVITVASVERWGNPASVFSSEYVFRFVEHIPTAEQPLRKPDSKTGELRGPTQVEASLSPLPILRAALVPPLAAWFLAYLVVWTVQWVKKGLKTS